MLISSRQCRLPDDNLWYQHKARRRRRFEIRHIIRPIAERDDADMRNAVLRATPLQRIAARTATSIALIDGSNASFHS